MSDEQPLPHGGSFPGNAPIELVISPGQWLESKSEPCRSDYPDEEIFLGIHEDDCKRDLRYPNEPVLRRKDMNVGEDILNQNMSQRDPVSLHLVSERQHALNGRAPPCCNGDVVCLRARINARDPQPPPPAWFLRDHGDVYESDIREHLSGMVVNWLRLDAQLNANWRPRRKGNNFERGSLQDLVRWGEVDYFSYYRDAARASCVSSVIV